MWYAHVRVYVLYAWQVQVRACMGVYLSIEKWWIEEEKNNLVFY